MSPLTLHVFGVYPYRAHVIPQSHSMAQPTMSHLTHTVCTVHPVYMYRAHVETPWSC